MNRVSLFDSRDRTSSDFARELVLLPGWNDGHWDKLLAYTDRQLGDAGEVVIRAREADRTLYILTRGQLEVLSPLGHSIASIAARSVVGEQLFLDGHPRSADVVAVTDVELRRLSLTAFDAFAVEEPELARDFLFDLARILSLRLRDTTELALQPR